VPGNIGLIGVLAHARLTELHVVQTTHERKALMADRRRRT
jgi:hypothetical protein